MERKQRGRRLTSRAELGRQTAPGYNSVMPEALYQPFPLPGRARGHVWHHVPATRRPRHFHREPELNLVTRGSAVFGMGDRNIPVVPGDLLWWAPGQDHVLLDASVDLNLFVIGLTPELSERILGTERTSRVTETTRVRVAPDALARLGELCSGVLPRDPMAVERLVGAFWRQAHALRTTIAEKHTFTIRALASLQQRPELRRSEIARAARGYPTEVSRHFHKDTGLTLTEYRKRLRLLRFIELARSGDRNLLSAALDSGFGSYSQCHRVFSDTLGCSPRRYFQSDVCTRMEQSFQPFGHPALTHSSDG